MVQIRNRVAGAHRMQLKQAFAWKDGGWEPGGLSE